MKQGQKVPFYTRGNRQRREGVCLYIVTQIESHRRTMSPRGKGDPDHHTLGSASWEEDTRLTVPSLAKALSLKNMTFGHFQNRRFLLRYRLRGKQK